MRLTATLILGLAAGPAVAGTAGMTAMSFPADHRDRPVSGAVWYPAKEGGAPERFGENAVFHGTSVMRDAPPSEGRFPVVLVSHGLGGNIRTLSWLSAGLAERGAVVVSVDHPDSTTGDFDMRAGLDHGSRAADLTAALDVLSSDPQWAGRLDLSHVVAAGFSYGGWTALSLAGVTGSLDDYATHCETLKAKSTHCADIARAGIDLRSLDAGRWDLSYKDGRITAVVALDPGLTYGLDVGDVADLVPDVTLIGLGDAATRLLATDTSPDGSNFDALLPGATVLSIVPASHFDALLVCKPMGAAILEEEGEDPVCDAVEGSDRARIHAEIVDAVAARLDLPGR